MPWCKAWQHHPHHHREGLARLGRNPLEVAAGADLPRAIRSISSHGRGSRQSSNQILHLATTQRAVGKVGAVAAVAAAAEAEAGARVSYLVPLMQQQQQQHRSLAQWVRPASRQPSSNREPGAANSVRQQVATAVLAPRLHPPGWGPRRATVHRPSSQLRLRRACLPPPLLWW